ncbi:MAG TPA: response regulator [Ktedonobacteraceae bacterium]|jgi:chemotaxis family two-component system response regulator PixH|nr:response regulator [Ktedonobacteraceae bacterium]
MVAPKILIIDDSATVRMFMVRALQKMGCQISLASNGTEGLQKAVQERPHCVILDVVLPGLNGYSLCRLLRAMDPAHDLAIIMISSKSTQVDQKWGLRQGADRYLPKPFTEEELIVTVKEVLNTTIHP